VYGLLSEMTVGDVVIENAGPRSGVAAPLIPDVGALYRSERGRLLRLAVLLVGDRASAEDVVQDAFIALHRRRAALVDPAAAPAYLSASVANGARSVLRRRRVAWRHRRAEEPEAGAAADADVLLADEHREVAEAVRRLPNRQQQVVVLRYWADLSEAEIAQVMGISRGTVKSNAARGMAQLQRYLEESQ
jgi:RNA polymerase sigma-70 factor (sigma-E family)